MIFGTGRGQDSAKSVVEKLFSQQNCKRASQQQSAYPGISLIPENIQLLKGVKVWNMKNW
jgi:hypothetical protein